MASTRTERSPAPPLPSEGIVELVPPGNFGFSGTVKLLVEADAVLVQELLKRGYTVKA